LFHLTPNRSHSHSDYMANAGQPVLAGIAS